MKSKTDSVERAFKAEFMSRPAAVCHDDWQADVMRYIAGSNQPSAALSLNGDTFVWPLAWSAAAAAVLIVSAAYLFLEPTALSLSSQWFSYITPAQQIVAAL